MVLRKYYEFNLESISKSKYVTAIFLVRTVSNFLTMGILNLPRGSPTVIRNTGSLGKSRNTSLITCKKHDKKVEFVLPEDDPEGWQVVKRGGKHDNKNRFIFSQKNFEIQNLDDDPTVKSFTPVNNTNPPSAPVATSQDFLSASILGVPIQKFSGENNSASNNNLKNDDDETMVPSDNKGEDNNPNDDGSEYGSTGSWNNDNEDDDKKNKNEIGVQIANNDEPNVESNFRIAYNQNDWKHKGGKGYNNVRIMFEALCTSLGNKMILHPTKHNTTPQPSPIHDIKNEWPADDDEFERFFHVTKKDAKPSTLTSRGTCANTNVFINLRTHHSDITIFGMLKQRLIDNNMYMNNENIDECKLNVVGFI